jgi:hypothetical protein
MNATYTTEFWTAAGERWMNGESQRVIALDLGVTVSALDREMMRLGYNKAAKLARKNGTTPDAGAQPWLTMTDDQWAVIGHKHTSGVALAELAAEIGCLPNWLRSEMKRRGFVVARTPRPTATVNGNGQTAADARAVKAESRVAELEREVASLENRNKNLNNDWHAANQTISTLRTEVSTLQREVTSANRVNHSGLSETRRVVKQAYGAMSRKHHPDMGGSAKAQTVVNDCFQDLLKRFQTN